MEELKLILDTIATLGAEAKWAFFVWLGFKTINAVLCGATIFGVVWLIVRSFRNASAMEQLRDEMGVGIHGYVTGSELAEMFKWIRQHRQTAR